MIKILDVNNHQEFFFEKITFLFHQSVAPSKKSMYANFEHSGTHPLLCSDCYCRIRARVLTKKKNRYLSFHGPRHGTVI